MQKLAFLALSLSVLACSSSSKETKPGENKGAQEKPAAESDKIGAVPSPSAAKPAEPAPEPAAKPAQKLGEAFCEALIGGSKIPPDDVKLFTQKPLGEEARTDVRTMVGYLDQIKECTPSTQTDVDKLAFGKGWYFDPILGLQSGEVAYVHPEKGWVLRFSFSAEAPLVPTKIVVWDPH
jgi:hypothetical protein